MSFNAKKRLFTKEEKRRQQFLAKANNDVNNADKWNAKARRCAERIDTYARVLWEERAHRDTAAQVPPAQVPPAQIQPPTNNDDTYIDLAIQADTNPVAAKELMDFEDSHRQVNGDFPSRKLNSIKAKLRSLLYKHRDDQINEHAIRTTFPGFTNNQIRICHRIASFISPYLPTRDKSMVPSRQLPFFLMANDLLRCTGYTKFTLKISPITKPTTLHALKLDAPTIYTLMCGPVKKLDLFDFDGLLIASRQLATESKDGVYSSFFDIEKIFHDCENYGMNFGQNMHVLPGLKTVRVNGYPIKTTTKVVDDEKITKAAPSDPSLAEEQETKRQKTVLEAHLRAAQRQLVTANEDLHTLYLENNLRRLKDTWIPTTDTELNAEQLQQNADTFARIQDVKDRRNAINRRINEHKEEVATVRQMIYRLGKPDTTTTSDLRHSLNASGYKCFGKARSFKLDENFMNSGDVVFTGTDNGLVTMTETVKFTLPRFNHHLKMYSGQQPAHQEDQNFFKLPKAFKVKSSDLHHRSGTRDYLNRLEKKKVGHPMLLQIERELSQASLYDCNNIQELNTRQERHQVNAQVIRNFYYSNQQSKRRRTHELQKKKCFDKVCSAERNHALERPTEEKLVMFVGDSGLGIGSRIKGFARYGGLWKPRKHSNHAAVCITSEHNTSQTCLFCFHKLSHPVRVQSGTIQTATGSFICTNQECPSVLRNCNTFGRDTLSALAIGMAGLAQVLCGVTFPCFDRSPTESKNNLFNHFATTF